MSNAERQSRFRRRNRISGSRQRLLCTWIDRDAWESLARIARITGQTKRATIEQVLRQTDTALRQRGKPLGKGLLVRARRPLKG